MPKRFHLNRPDLAREVTEALADGKDIVRAETNEDYRVNVRKCPYDNQERLVGFAAVLPAPAGCRLFCRTGKE